MSRGILRIVFLDTIFYELSDVSLIKQINLRVWLYLCEILLKKAFKPWFSYIERSHLVGNIATLYHYRLELKRRYMSRIIICFYILRKLYPWILNATLIVIWANCWNLAKTASTVSWIIVVNPVGFTSKSRKANSEKIGWPWGYRTTINPYSFPHTYIPVPICKTTYWLHICDH